MKKLILLSLLLMAVSQAKVEPEKRHRAQMRLLDSFLTNHHYQNAILDDKKSKEILQKYLTYLDFSKVFFTQADIKSFQRYETLLDDFAHKGELIDIYEMYDASQEKRKQHAQWSLQRLKRGFGDNVKGSLQLDREKVDWAKDDSELRQRWEKRLLNEWIVLRLAKQSDKKAREVLSKRYHNVLKRMKKSKADEVFQLYANAVTSVYDPHTSYFSPITSETFDMSMSLSLEGIGAQLTIEDELITIKELIAGGPAKKSGKLAANDKILGVAQGKTGAMEDVVGWRLDEAVGLIRGKRGTTVRLQIQKARNDEIVEVVLVRDKIKLEEQAAKSEIKRFEKNGKVYRVGVIDLPSFYVDFAAAGRGDKNYRSTTRDVKRLITDLTKEGIDGLMIDLRNNGGGSLTEAVSLTGLFFNDGPVVQVRRSDGSLQVHEDEDGETFYTGPLAVLINENSASASEIFAGAIKDYGRGVILGEPTFGKGTVQTIIDLGRFLPSSKDKIGQLKMTIAMFYRVNGSSTQLKGITPDLYIPNKESYVEGGEREEEHALAWRQIEAIDHQQFALVTDDIIDKLKNAYRQNADTPLFKNLVALLAWQQQEIDDTIVPLSLKARLLRKNKLRDKSLSLQNKFRKIYGYPLLTSAYWDKEDKDKTEAEKADDKKYEVDAVLDIAAKTVADYVRIIEQQ
ncbi:MAG: tail-specific protease [Gammaproteobacteria bacterium]|nr:MAG: tail-specific protease [Gammaproteobacteria bacterium]